MFVCSFFYDIPNVIPQVYESSIAARNKVYTVQRDWRRPGAPGGGVGAGAQPRTPAGEQGM